MHLSIIYPFTYLPASHLAIHPPTHHPPIHPSICQLSAFVCLSIHPTILFIHKLHASVRPSHNHPSCIHLTNSPSTDPPFLHASAQSSSLHLSPSIPHPPVSVHLSTPIRLSTIYPPTPTQHRFLGPGPEQCVLSDSE